MPHSNATASETSSTSVSRGTLRSRSQVSALDIAARSVLESQMFGGSLASMVAERALDHCWDGLFQHAALRAGPTAAIGLLQQLAAAVGREPREQLAAPPGPREQLYRRIRLLSASATRRDPLQASELFQQGEGSYRKQLAELRKRLRQALTSDLCSVIELRFARRLRSEEVAFVLELPVEDVERAEALGLELAEQVVGRRPASCDRTLEGALLEAFALDPRYARAPRRRQRAPVLPAGTVIGERYEIEELLGAGAFADVYRARDREVTDHVVALKILRAAAEDARSTHAAMRELRLIASVFHPSIVQLKDHGWHAGRLWFVMPLYRGETLAARVRRAPLSRAEAREVFEPLAEALATMHRVGVLHQDIKPDNVFLAELDPTPETELDGASAEPSSASAGTRAPRRILPVLLDLGVAAKDAESVLAGTPAYFAPEVAARFAGIADPPPVGPKADVFSLALTLQHALDPTPPELAFGGSVDAFVAYRAAHAPAPSARPDLKSLRPWLERWLSFAPDERPTAEELRRELAALTRPQEEAARRMTTLRWAVPTALALLALFGSVVFGLSREASLQRIEAETARERAEQARARAARVAANLSEQHERRRQLEATIAKLQDEYQSSRMTREQLASRLAQTEAELSVNAERQALLTVRVRQQQDELREAREEQEQIASELQGVSTRRDELAARLERASNALEQEREKRERLEQEASDLSARLQRVVAEGQIADARQKELAATRTLLTELIDDTAARRP